MLGIVISDTLSNVTDIHNDLEVSVCNELKNKSGKSELIGKIQVPLLRVSYPLSLLFTPLLLLPLLLPSLLLFLPPLSLSLPHPLLLPDTQIVSGVPKMYVLKDKHCLQSAKSGVVFLECELVYNPVRACIRTINPRESKLLEEEQKFKRKVISSFSGLGGEEKGVHLEQPTKLKCFHLNLSVSHT